MSADRIAQARAAICRTRGVAERAPKAPPSTEPAAPVPHRLQAVTEADELATRGKAETAPEWQARITEASKSVRVRVYDRGAHCTWDSLDGNREGYIVGGAA